MMNLRNGWPGIESVDVVGAGQAGLAFTMAGGQVTHNPGQELAQ